MLSDKLTKTTTTTTSTGTISQRVKFNAKIAMKNT